MTPDQTKQAVAEERISWRIRGAFAVMLARTLAGLALAWVVKALTPRAWIPLPAWEPLPGPHQVGVRDTDILDPARQEPQRPGEARKIMARVWYPAGPGTEQRRRFHAPDEASWLSGNKPKPLAGRIELLSAIETWARQDAPALTGAARFPVLLFSHGLGGVVSQNTHLCERLASHGYLVVSIAHPYGGASVRFADGGEAVMTPELYKRKFNLKALSLPSIAVRLARTWGAAVQAAEKILSLPGLQPELRVWVDDTSAVLDQLIAGNTAPPLRDVLQLADFGRVGAFGMSFGGAASAAVAQRDCRIRAAINLDGNQYGTELWDTSIGVPLLELRSEDALIGTGGTFNDLHYERFEESGSSGRVWRYLVTGSRHADFTDLTLLGNRLLRRLVGHGPVNGPRMSAAVLDLTLRFFDRHLKGNTVAWPADPRRIWPELRLIDTSGLRAWAQQGRRQV